MKLDEVGDILSGGAGAKVAAREGGGGRKRVPWEGEECSGRIAARGHGHGQCRRESLHIC